MAEGWGEEMEGGLSVVSAVVEACFTRRYQLCG